VTVWTLQAGIPDADMKSGMKLKLEAINPTTGAAITGVTATAWAIYGIDVSEELNQLEDLIPRYSDVETIEV
jgi:hypothetical protein